LKVAELKSAAILARGYTLWTKIINSATSAWKRKKFNRSPSAFLPAKWKNYNLFPLLLLRKKQKTNGGGKMKLLYSRIT
jgi:hypothetical protein